MTTKSLIELSRRDLIKAAGWGLAGASVALPALAAAGPVDSGKVVGGKVEFPEWRGPGDALGRPPPAPLPPAQRLGFAIVGLGRLSLEEILPAFAQSTQAKPVAVVSGTPDKAKLVAAQYGIKAESIYGYDDFAKIKDNPEIQAVYVVLPNSMHREYVVKAAQAGKHVLCEKPMATNSADARAMIAACAQAKVKLMIGYRCQYEPFNREVARLLHSGELGACRLVEASNTQSMGDPAQWRLKKAMAGGGALPDIGLYCLNGARFVTGEEPVEVFARTFSPKNDPRFREVEETIAFMLRFPSGIIASCTSSYNIHNTKDFTVRMERGSAVLKEAFSYGGKQLHVTGVVDGHNGEKQLQIEPRNQFALELDHLAKCVREDLTPHTPGEEGLQDQLLMEALYASAEKGAPVAVPPPAGPTRGTRLD